MKWESYDCAASESARSSNEWHRHLELCTIVSITGPMAPKRQRRSLDGVLRLSNFKYELRWEEEGCGEDKERGDGKIISSQDDQRNVYPSKKRGRHNIASMKVEHNPKAAMTNTTRLLHLEHEILDAETDISASFQVRIFKEGSGSAAANIRCQNKGQIGTQKESYMRTATSESMHICPLTHACS